MGVIIATLSRPSASSGSRTRSSRTPEELRTYTIGIGMLVVSLFCTGLLGLLQEKTYRKYGPCWREGVFYTVGVSPFVKSSSSWLISLFLYAARAVPPRFHISRIRYHPGLEEPFECLLAAFGHDLICYTRCKSCFSINMRLRRQPLVFGPWII